MKNEMSPKRIKDIRSTEKPKASPLSGMSSEKNDPPPITLVCILGPTGSKEEYEARVADIKAKSEVIFSKHRTRRR